MDIKLSAFIAMSLDGYIARYNGKLDFLETNSDKLDAEDYGYQAFIGSVDCIVMGRNSFEKVVSFPTWPYHNKRVIVLSRAWDRIPDQFADLAELYSGKAELLTVELQNQGVRHLYVDGGVTIQSFLQQNLLNEITITTVPILLGKGISLFGMLREDLKLKLEHHKSFDSDFVQSRYSFIK
ncbi:MAG: dihydrofolate reductase family protein [Kangiellaceae bacterium]|nr:dihydrofolate reductase family protein [Kangiellaceae bacterium]